MAPDRTAHLRTRLIDWYSAHARDLPWRRTADPWAILVSEIMLQQTRVDTVIPYYLRFLERFPDPAALAAAEADELYRYWQGLGYYSRARNLQAAARFLVDSAWPLTGEGLRMIPGVGPYTAAAVGSIAFGLPLAVADGNVKRVFSRLYALEGTLGTARHTAEIQEFTERWLDKTDPGRWNQAVMELGALVCTAKPRCPHCPWREDCAAYATGEPTHFPRKAPAAPRPVRRQEVFLLENERGILMWRRKPGGLLGGLWEFPWLDVPSFSDQPELPFDRSGTELTLLGTHEHDYSHFHLSLRYWRWRGVTPEWSGPRHDRTEWVALDRLVDLPLHRAMEPLRRMVTANSPLDRSRSKVTL